MSSWIGFGVETGFDLIKSDKLDDELHVTLAYLTKKDLGSKEVDFLFPLLNGVSLALRRRWVYPAIVPSELAGGAIVLKLEPDPMILGLRERLVETLRTQHIPVDTKYQFTPHLTLGYTGDGYSIGDASRPVDRRTALTNLFLNIGPTRFRFHM